MSQLSEPLNSKHKKPEFSCGKEMLDTYIKKKQVKMLKESFLFVL